MKSVRSVPKERLLSIDFFRGFTMFLLIGEFTGIYQTLVSPNLNSEILYYIGNQFHHHPWHGLRFWDLIQPFFMFIVGVAIPFSLDKRKKMGQNREKLLKHALFRSLLLLFLGWWLYCIDDGEISFRFQNVLAQLSVTYLVTFLIRNWKTSFQLLFSVGLLLLTEFLYRTFPVGGFDQPFAPAQNFGAWVDLQISGELSSGHWVSFNAIPTTAHTIWGFITGRYLLKRRSSFNELRPLLIFGLLLLLAGYIAGNYSPVIKRIATSSFVLVSGGWSIIAMTFSYYLIDILGMIRFARFFVFVGMNPLFIYLFSHIGGAELINNIFIPFSAFIFSSGQPIYGQILNSAISWLFLWYICYWLYKKRIFIKI